MPDATAGSRVKALDWPPTVYAQDNTNISGISSDDYTTGGHPLVAVTFTANTFGKILLTVGGCGRGDGQDTRLDLAPQIFLGTNASGEEILAPAVFNRGLTFPEGNVYVCHSRTTRLQGLEPGATYFARLVHKKVGNTTGDFARRELVITPTS